MKYYGNKKTKVLHKATQGDACRASEIAPKNRTSFELVRTAEELGYRLCKICFKG